LAHRGPDDADSQYFENDRIALGHRRLSFLDLSAAGRQPLCNEDGTVWIVLNGEIYNYVELRQELEAAGHTFKTHTDTEVIVHGYEQWGERVVDRLKGMFAFGLLDLPRKRLFLARDRFGIKPLYYCQANGMVVFASELKAIMACADVPRQPDMTAFADYLIYRYIPSPKTIWQGISKLPPAHYWVYDYQTGQATETEYWKLTYGEGNENPYELAKEAGELMQQSVAIHARADVPIGAFLSGGYDSSAIVYFLNKIGYKPETFAIGFEGWDNSEHLYAEMVAKHLHVPFNYYLANDSTLDLMDIMPDVYDEPIADISILPTWLVSQQAVKKTKAVMSGEGADELMGGYWWEKKFFGQHHNVSFKERLKALFNKQDTIEFYADAMSMGRFDQAELRKAFQPEQYQYLPEDTEWFYRQNFDAKLSPLKSIQQMDIKCFMGELVLVKMDRASMAGSLEVRVPFLDHELFEKVFANREDVYFQPDKTKFLLYENIKNHLPKAILDRPKQGFVGPDGFYMNMMRYGNILQQSHLVAAGIIRQTYIDELFSAKDHWRLWKLAVLEKWYRRWIN
jgi:asparagine synthase (glutamine-hydrolysing)